MTADPSQRLLREGTWQDDAACGTSDGDAWFPESGGNGRPAKRICRSCPVQPQCLEYALETNQGYGVWGGLSTDERDCLKRDRRRVA
jgi:WhiB family transcriptional regulator, redox-sensing transcriptional regulator